MKLNEGVRSRESGARTPETGARSRRAPARTFEDLIVWQKAHASLILARDLGYADSTPFLVQLEEASRLPAAYSAAIQTPGS